MQKRTKYACDPCRSRKVKCDSEDTSKPCSKCIDVEIRCTYNYLRKKRKPNIALQQPAQVSESAKSLVQTIIAAPESILPQEAGVLRPILVSLAKYARSLENELTGSRTLMPEEESPVARTSSSLFQPTTSSASPSSDGSDIEHSDVEVAAESFKQLSLGLCQERYLGDSNNMFFLHNAMNLWKGKVNLNLGLAQRPHFWGNHIWQMLPEALPPPYLFPEDDLLWNLIHIYFDQISLYFPLLHQPTFKRDVANGLHLLDRDFGAVVLAVCALAARNSDDPRNLIEGTILTTGWRWFRQIRIFRPNVFEPTTLYELQLFCLAHVYLRDTTFLDSTWVLGAIGIRLAQDIGVHRLKPGGARTVENELYIRAFWILWNLDVEQSIMLGRPTATTPEEFDLNEAAECDDQYWERSGQNEAFSQPEGEISLLSFHKHYVKLMKIAASMQKTIYAIKTPVDVKLSAMEWTQQMVIEHDSALNDWLDSLPEHLRWDPQASSETFLNQSAILFCSFYWVQMHVHKKILQTYPANSTSTFPSLAICSNTARSIVRIVQVQHRRSAVRFYSFGIKLVHCITMLFVVVWRSMHVKNSGTTDTNGVLTDVKTALNLLADLETRSQTNGRMVDKLKAFIAHRHILPDMETARTSMPVPSLKRSRDSNELDASYAVHESDQLTPHSEPHLSRAGISSRLPETDEYSELVDDPPRAESQGAPRLPSGSDQYNASILAQQLGQPHFASESAPLPGASTWNVAENFGPASSSFSSLPNSGLAGMFSMDAPHGSEFSHAIGGEIYSDPSGLIGSGPNVGSGFTYSASGDLDRSMLSEHDWELFMKSIDEAVMDAGY